MDRLKNHPQKHPWNPNCNWQDSWAQICRLACCYAPQCSDILCGSCMQSLVRPLVQVRYACVECLNTDDELFDLCSDCFNDKRAPHVGKDQQVHSDMWISVDKHGAHADGIVRLVAKDATIVELSSSDLRVQFDQPFECASCLELLQEKASVPGCAHGMCRPCLLAMLRASARNVFFEGHMPIPSYFCPECRRDTQRAAQIRRIVAELEQILESDDLSSAPSLKNRQVKRTDSLIKDAVQQLKSVHAGSHNSHLHKALDGYLMYHYSKLKSEKVGKTKMKGRFSDPLFETQLDVLAPRGNVRRKVNIGAPHGNLYIGTKAAAKDSQGLMERNIRAIVNVGAGVCHFPSQFQYLKLKLQDNRNASLTPEALRAIPFINNHLDAGHNVLIHCSGGCSRSPSIAVAYLILDRGLTLEQALVVVRAARSAARPNPWFMEQLANY